MNFLTGDIKSLYRKFFIASVGSALSVSIYSSVDAIAIGHAEGPLGAAAMAVITPLYGIILFFAILCGIGGSVLMSNAKGEGSDEKGNAYFTASIILMGIITVLVWAAFALFHEQIFTFFGADETTLPKVMEYAFWLILFFPFFIIPTFISAFIRNDGAPGLTMVAVLTGGIFNIFGDWFLAFPMGMGMKGVALATVIGNCLQVIIMCSHFFRKKCNLKLVKPFKLRKACQKILSIGFSSSILDLGTVILCIIMNNQIMKYGGTTALSVFGVVSTITSLFQALFSGVGQAIQPLVSSNFGASQKERVQSVLRMSLQTVMIMGVLFTALGQLFPIQMANLFMDTTPEVLAVAPIIVRLYFLLFLTLGITVLSTYYLQSIMREKMAMLVAILRSFVISGLLLYILPLFLELNGVLLAMPIAELIVAIIALVYIKKKT